MSWGVSLRKSLRKEQRNLEFIICDNTEERAEERRTRERKEVVRNENFKYKLTKLCCKFLGE